MIGCQKESMECVVDLPCFEEAELVVDQGQDLDNYEGSFSLGHKLQIGDQAFQVSGFYLDFITFGEEGESLVVAQGHDLADKLMGSKSFILSSDERLKVGFNYRNGRVRDQGRKGMQFISHHEIEQRLICGGMGVVIVDKLSMGDLVYP